MIDLFFHIGGGYPARIGSGASQLLGEAVKACSDSGRACIITDSGVPGDHLERCLTVLREAGIEASVFTIPCGENSKSIDMLIGVYDFLCGYEYTREDCIIGVGGGVALDVAGFAAATYLRGVSFISVPTTLIAQTDSAYGGKTGVDFMGGKNILGLISHPREVLCDTGFLKTLPRAEIACGMGEIIKYGAIADPSILENVSGALPSEETIARCVEIKRRYVEADEFDTGERHILNFGHTFGHAIEAYSGYTVPHGQAVAYGMLAAIKLGEKLGVTDGACYPAVISSCEACGLDTDWEEKAENARGLIVKDKKSNGTSVDMVLLESLGRPVRRKIPLADLIR